MTKNYLVYGAHAVKAALTHHPEKVKKLFLQSHRNDKRAEEIAQLAKHAQITIQMIDKPKLDILLDNGIHQGFAAELMACPPSLNENDLEKRLDQLNAPPFLLILDNIQDPHNLGACLRTANAAGVHAVISPKDNAVGLTPSVCKVASGAIETLSFIQVTNLVRTLNQLKSRGIWIVGMDEKANTCLYQQNLTGPLAIAIGQEGSGLRRLTKAACDFLLHIPMMGMIPSLNASVATGITLFEAVRQRQIYYH